MYPRNTSMPVEDKKHHSSLALDPQEASVINPTVCPVHTAVGGGPGPVSHRLKAPYQIMVESPHRPRFRASQNRHLVKLVCMPFMSCFKMYPALPLPATSSLQTWEAQDHPPLVQAAVHFLARCSCPLSTRLMHAQRCHARCLPWPPHVLFPLGRLSFSHISIWEFPALSTAQQEGSPSGHLTP